MAMNREQAIIIMNRLGTGTSDLTTTINVIIDFLNTEGNQDVAEAFTNRLNAIGTIAITSLNPSVVTAYKNRSSSGRTYHDRL